MTEEKVCELADNLVDIANDGVKEYKKSSKKTKDLVSVIVLCTLLFIASFACISTYSAVKKASEVVSTISGDVVGVMKGVITLPTSYGEGKIAGLSAEDTKAYIENELKEVGELDVLVSGVKITNLHQIGNNYQGLYVSKGYAVFSIDISTIEVSNSESEVSITINEPKVQVYIDDESTKKIAEWQKHTWTGSSEDGYFAYLNSWEHSKQEIENSVDNYDSLLKDARQAGREEIESLVKSICGKEKSVNVQYKEES